MKYTESHEWVNVEENLAIIGITEFAQGELGDVVFVELPQVGKEVSKGEEIAVLESTKAAADVYSPVSGKVIEVNERLNQEPELVNQSPVDQGWIAKVALSSDAELEALMDQGTYQKLVS